MVHTPIFDGLHTAHFQNARKIKQLPTFIHSVTLFITQVFNTLAKSKQPVDNSKNGESISHPLTPEPAEPPPVAYRTGTSLVATTPTAIALRWGCQTRIDLSAHLPTSRGIPFPKSNDSREVRLVHLLHRYRFTRPVPGRGLTRGGGIFCFVRFRSRGGGGVVGLVGFRVVVGCG